MLWPDFLPCKIIAGGFEKAFPDSRLRTAPQRGRAFLRAGSTATPVRVSAQMEMTVAQVARLERFWEEDTEEGTQPFLIRDNVYHGAISTDETGEPMEDESGEVMTGVYYWLVQFANPPVTRRLGTTKRLVTLDLEVL